MAIQAYGTITITDLLDTATYIYYSATNTNITTNWHSTPTSSDKYIGIYSGPPVAGGQPTNPTDAIYQAMDISKYVGEDGAPGAAGRGISSTAIAYTTSSSGTQVPSSDWGPDVPTVSQGQYLWTRMTITYTDSTTSISYSVSRNAVNGTNGTNGTSPTVTSTAIAYQQSTDGTNVPTGTWQTSPPAATAGQYMWTRTTVTYSDSKTAVSYSVSKNGTNGTNGTSPTRYTLLVTPSSIIKNQGGSLSSTSITLNAYSQTGNAAQAAYSGRFKIETTTNGSSWTAVYTSSGNQSTYTYSSIAATVKALRCSLYLAGGTATLLAQEVVPVITDGIDGDLYNVKVNTDTIYRIYQSSGNLTISQAAYDISLYQKSGTVLVPGTGYTIQIAMLPIMAAGDATIETQILSTGYSDLLSTDTTAGVGIGGKVNTTTKNNLLTISNNQYHFSLQTLMTAVESSTTYTAEIEALKDILKKQTVVFAVSFLISSKVVTRQLLHFNTWLSDDLAQFSEHAVDIASAINNAHFNFSTEGLTISDGNLRIKLNGDDVFYVDNSVQPSKLVMRGTVYADNGIFNGEIHATSGTFTGTIHATSGTFTGTIQAQDGTIGGFTISDNKLVSGDGNITLQGGGTGLIKAKNIEIGDGAVITNYINLGSSARLYGNDSDILLVAGTNSSYTNPTIQINKNGTMSLGSLSFNGANSTIQGDEWILTPTVAEFTNIIASGKISSSIFEYNKMQVVGGQMIFRPVAEIKSITGSSKTFTITLDTDITLPLYSVLKLYRSTNSFGTEEGINAQVTAVTTSNNIITYTVATGTAIAAADVSSYRYIMHFGEVNPNQIEIINNALLLGINSMSTGGLLLPKGLTMKEPISYDNINKTIMFGNTPRVYLGDLSTITGLNLAAEGFKYGLYADNAVLNGSLTTKVRGTIDGNLYDNVNKPYYAIYMTTTSPYPIANASDTYSIIVKVQPNTSYTITKIQSGRCRMAFYDSYPSVGVNANGGYYSSNSAVTRTFTTGNTTQYVVFYIYHTGDSPAYCTLDEVLSSIVVKDNTHTGYKSTYAGINTNAPVISQRIVGSTDNSVVIWAGAESIESSAIATAPFQVTQDGSIYANKGIFEGTIITRANIQASALYAAKIYGGTQETEAALDIYSTYHGINFYNSKNTTSASDDVLTLSINTNGLVAYSSDGTVSKQFITIDSNGNAQFSGAVSAESLGFGNFTVSGSEIINNDTGKILIDNSEFRYTNNSAIRLSITQGNTQINTTQTILLSDLILGTTATGKLNYKKVSDGYDLYID